MTTDPSVIDSPDGVVQTNALEIEEGRIKTIYVVRNPDKLKHLSS